jgi:outer membrane biosynthesis protein TonB
MQALWADGWFYISSAGLLVSGSLFFFLLGQYRAAADAVDGREAAEPEAEAHVAPVRRVYSPEEPAPAAKVASVPAEKAEPQAPAPSPAPTAAPATRDSTTPGGVSPAVVYLQNIQSNLNELHGEIRDLSQRVHAIASRDEALIERLGELSATVAELKGASEAAKPRARKSAPSTEVAAPATPATVPLERPSDKTRPTFEINELAGLVAPAEPKPEAVVEAKSAPVVEAKPEPVAAAKAEPVPEPKPAPVAEVKLEPSPDATIRVELPPADAAADEKPRRGPVWPV